MPWIKMEIIVAGECVLLLLLLFVVVVVVVVVVVLDVVDTVFYVWYFCVCVVHSASAVVHCSPHLDTQ